MKTGPKEGRRESKYDYAQPQLMLDGLIINWTGHKEYKNMLAIHMYFHSTERFLSLVILVMF